MKPSEVIRMALENNYSRNCCFKECDNGKKFYMCHAIQIMDIDSDWKTKTEKVIEDFLAKSEFITITNHLKYINYNGNYKRLVDRYGHEAKCVFKLRLKFWNEFIADLESKGL